jgi:HSP20 family protein
MYLTTSRRIAHPLQSLRRLNTLLDEAFSNWPAQSSDFGAITSTWIPATDVFEDKDAVRIVAEVPGVNPQDVKLSVENNVLTIRGEKKQTAEEKTERLHRYERSYGVFERSFALPSTVDPEKIEAKVDAGVLTVLLPKSERARLREIAVKVA